MEKYEFKYDYKRQVLSRTKDGVTEEKHMVITSSEEFLKAIAEWKE